jgi:cyclase
MKTVRIIPRLDIKGPNLVKGIHLEGLRVLGKPSDFAQFYYEHGADELLFMDVVASLYERNSLHDIITETAKKIFIPITVGGGIRNINDIRMMLRIGADKVSINTAAIKRPNFIKEAAEEFGSSTIVVAIEAVKSQDGNYYAFIDNGREHTGINVLDWAQEVVRLGAGEIIITSVDREGTGRGIDIELTRSISESVSIPIIAHGGIGSLQEVINIIDNENINSISIGSALHYRAMKNFNFMNTQEGNVDFLRSGKNNNSIKSFDLKELKSILNSRSLYCRLQ